MHVHVALSLATHVAITCTASCLLLQTILHVGCLCLQATHAAAERLVAGGLHQGSLRIDLGICSGECPQHLGTGMHEAFLPFPFLCIKDGIDAIHLAFLDAPPGSLADDGLETSKADGLVEGAR